MEELEAIIDNVKNDPNVEEDVKIQRLKTLLNLSDEEILRIKEKSKKGLSGQEKIVMSDEDKNKNIKIEAKKKRERINLNFSNPNLGGVGLYDANAEKNKLKKEIKETVSLFN